MEFVGQLVVGRVAVETPAGTVVDDALRGETVYAHFSMGMDDVAVAKVDAHMGDVSLLIAEETKVVAACLLQRGNGAALRGLL